MITCLAVVAAAGLTLAVAAIARALRMPQAKGSMTEVGLRFARWMIAALLAASGIWIAISPRAEQPLLDAVERAFPAVRSAYLEDTVQAPRDDRERRDLLARSREDNRWSIAGVMLALAGSFIVSLPSKRTIPHRP
jgi:hypothetical protein